MSSAMPGDKMNRRWSTLVLVLALGATLGAGAAAAADCLVGGTCILGLCLGGTPTSCPGDAVPCTRDACDPVRGCVHVPDPALCEDGDPCTAGSCDPTRGCVQVPATGAACDDGDGCTTADRCALGRCVGGPVECASDGFACTDEICVEGGCRSIPVDGRCAAEECALAACRPEDRRADRRGCLVTPRADGEPCTDDGVACTDDVCDAGGCLHVPIDSRCGAPGECSLALCAPERGDRDDAGCVPGPAPQPGEPAACAEDGDPCSDDRCEVDGCRHEPVPEAERCAPIRPAFRRVLGLGALARGLVAGLEDGEPRGRAVADALAARLRRAEAELAAAGQLLAGRVAVPPRPSRHPRVLAETRAQERARGALAEVKRTPRHVRGVVGAARKHRVRAALGAARSATLGRRSRALLRGTLALKTELEHLQAVVGTFVRPETLSRGGSDGE
jgi:hypothetical protein